MILTMLKPLNRIKGQEPVFKKACGPFVSSLCQNHPFNIHKTLHAAFINEVFLMKNYSHISSEKISYNKICGSYKNILTRLLTEEYFCSSLIIADFFNNITIKHYSILRFVYFALIFSWYIFPVL